MILKLLLAVRILCNKENIIKLDEFGFLKEIHEIHENHEINKIHEIHEIYKCNFRKDTFKGPMDYSPYVFASLVTTPSLCKIRCALHPRSGFGRIFPVLDES